MRDHLDMKLEERIAWLCSLGLMAVIAAVLAWRLNQAHEELRLRRLQPTLEERVGVLEEKVACWQTIHPKRCQ